MGTISRLLVLAMAIFIAVECGKALVIESPKKFEELPDWSVCTPECKAKSFTEKFIYANANDFGRETPVLNSNVAFAVRRDNCGRGFTLIALLRDGRMVATDPESGSGFKVWKPSSDELALLYLALGRMQEVDELNFRNGKYCFPHITDITFFRNGKSRNVRIDDEFMGRSDIHTWLGDGIVVPQSIKDFYRTVVLASRTNAAMWPEFIEIKVSNLDDKVGHYCYELEQNTSEDLEKYLELRCRPNFAVTRCNCSPLMFEQLMNLEWNRGNTKIGNHIYSFDADYR